MRDSRMVVIDPGECIDCGACLPECPIGAILDAPEGDAYWAQINANLAPSYKGQKGATRAKSDPRGGQTTPWLASFPSARFSNDAMAFEAEVVPARIQKSCAVAQLFFCPVEQPGLLARVQ